MRIFRQHKGLLASLAGLAMLAHVFAAAFCPNMNSHRSGSGYFNSVLGWVTLCLPSSLSSSLVNGSAKTNPGGDQGTTADHTGMCAALCAAVVAAVTAFVALVLVGVSFVVSVPRRWTFISRRTQRHILFGGIGSRAPPALI